MSIRAIIIRMPGKIDGEDDTNDHTDYGSLSHRKNASGTEDARKIRCFD